ncbi:MAG: AAA family ATPase [Patescibacteria group bacterium]
MSGFFDFIKKNPSDASGTPSGGQQSPQNVQQVSSQEQVVAQSGGSYNGIGGTPNGGTPYNGIGATPNGGQPYNGIGSTPNGGQPYNGIGTPPAPQVPETAAPAQTPSQPTAAASQQPPQQASTDQSNEQSTSETQDGQQDNASEQTSEAAQNKTDTNEKTEVSEQGEDAKTDNQKDNEQAADGQTKEGEKKQDEEPDAASPQQQKRMNMDVMTHLTQRSNRVFLSANNKAKELKINEVDSEHLLHGLLADPEIYKLLSSMKIQAQVVEQELEKVYKKGEDTGGNPQVSPRVKRILENSLMLARKLGYEFISPEHLLLATYEEGEGVGARILQKVGLDKDALKKKILGKKASSEEDKKSEKKKSALEQYTIDLTKNAQEGKLDPCVGRSQEIERVVHILSRRLKNNPVLIGEPGVGKTAIVEGLAQRIVNKQVPETLLDKRILQLDLMAVVAGASHRGEFEQRMKDLVEEVTDGKGSIILFIDEIHNIMGAGGGGDGTSDASNFLKPALSRGQIQLIGATTITEYKIIEKDGALERRFQSVLVPEPDEENAIKMLKALRNKFEAFHRVKIPDTAIEAAIKLSKRYIGDRYLPDKAVDLMDEAASAVRLPLISLPEEIKNKEERIAQLSQERDEAEQKHDKVRSRILNSKIDDLQAELNEKKDEYAMKKGQTTSSVSVNMVKDIIATRTGIPVSKLSGSEKEKLSNLEDIMHERMIGQERAVASVSQAVKRGRAGLKSNNRPIGSFVFLGPTGVGKTELAKTLADVLFGQEQAMIRFDMTEYMEKHEVAKLLGPPPGYVGYEEGGKLTEAVRQRQYAVVLFDEVEKAHPDIFNILLQILDDGRLTDNKGRTISFKNVVVICTSNIGSKMITEELMKGGNKGEAEEPPALSTYTFSPRGREILSIGTKYFERDASTTPKPPQEQKEDESNDAEQGKDGKEASKKDDEKKQETQQKSGTTAWSNNMLFDYFAGQKIENPQEEEGGTDEEDAAGFPSIGYDTHTISPKGVETITRDSTMFLRNSTTAKVWQTQSLIDYFKDGMVINALPDAPDEQLPTAKLKTHAFSPSEIEIVTYRDRFWKRKSSTNDWETGLLKDYFLEQTVKGGDSFPITHWDIHTFSPTGREIIIVGETIWFHEDGVKEWTCQSLHDYFGSDFPLEDELEEKGKIENESDSKKYDVIKEKVMSELLKFFRPELVNRFDEVIVFEPLKFIHMIAIVKLQLKSLTKLLEEQELGIHFTEGAIKEIVRSGFDPVFGARPLRRAIQKLIENPISEMIIAEQVKPGDMIYVDFDGEKLVFDVERTEFLEKKNSEKQNFTPLNVPAFLGIYYADQKEQIMKELADIFPTYAVKQEGATAEQGKTADKKSDEAGNVDAANNAVNEENSAQEEVTNNQQPQDPAQTKEAGVNNEVQQNNGTKEQKESGTIQGTEAKNQVPGQTKPEERKGGAVQQLTQPKQNGAPVMNGKVNGSQQSVQAPPLSA